MHYKLLAEREYPMLHNEQVVVSPWTQVEQLGMTKLQVKQLSPAAFRYVDEALGQRQSDPDA